MINYTARAKRFGALSSMYCLWCWRQHRGHIPAGNPLHVEEDKILRKPFFGVPFGPGMGTTLESGPKDRAFQKAIYRAMIAHSRDAHPWNIENMIRLGWIKK